MIQPFKSTRKPLTSTCIAIYKKSLDGWMNQAYSRLSTTHGHITDCKLVCMYWTRLVLVRPVTSLYSAKKSLKERMGKLAVSEQTLA